MVFFETKNPNSGKFLKALKWKRLVYFMAIWNILQPFGIFLWPFGNLVGIWYIFPRFGILNHDKKSGNPEPNIKHATFATTTNSENSVNATEMPSIRCTCT
jgi:hypothetical protein